ncbi:N-acetylglucosamine kinase [Flectobacillus major]|uniref:N-acetylglucosamine kinase n=1 Tax=Flectobacillus major TaxID=103 RepID=UPI0003FCFB77|nr:N-acetylglucosamine kinase [Flectobacillus major]
MILIADSGSTKTDWRTISSDGQIAQFKTIGFNPYYQDTTSIADELRSTLAPKITNTITAIHFYGTGVTNLEKGQIIKDALALVFPAATDIQVNNDMLAAARALAGQDTGIVCILGTGSNSCFYDGYQIAHQIPPLGFWLGDEGSGGYLGKQLMLSYLHKEMPQELREKFEKRFGAKDRLEILDNAYHKPFPNRYFASFSKFLFDNRSHPFAYLLVYQSFEAFFDKYLLKYTDCQQYKIHFTGSVAFYYSDILRRVATEKGCTVGIIMESPIAGLTLFHQSVQSIQ